VNVMSSSQSVLVDDCDEQWPVGING